MNRVYDDIAHIMEKINSRERYLNQHLQHPLADFRAVQDQRATIKDLYRRASNGLVEKSRLLAEVFIFYNLSLGKSI
jgi:Intra-flagellar transport protein 57